MSNSRDAILAHIDDDNGTPGSPDAVKNGCECPREDNHHGEGRPGTAGPEFVVVLHCPLHGRLLEAL